MKNSKRAPEADMISAPRALAILSGGFVGMAIFSTGFSLLLQWLRLRPTPLKYEKEYE